MKGFIIKNKLKTVLIMLCVFMLTHSFVFAKVKYDCGNYPKNVTNTRRCEAYGSVMGSNSCTCEVTCNEDTGYSTCSCSVSASSGTGTRTGTYGTCQFSWSCSAQSISNGGKKTGNVVDTNANITEQQCPNCSSGTVKYAYDASGCGDTTYQCCKTGTYSAD